MKNIIYLIILLTFALTCNHKPLFANYTYIICADKSKNWDWLDGSIVDGIWIKKHVKGNFFSRSFLLEGGINHYKILREECKNQFGNQFIYPQPSFYSFSNWSVFTDKEGVKFPGHETLIYNSDKMPRI
jgi:hypothetical protein